MVEQDAVAVASELDTHHTPETNGRMSVCRRCGAHTDSPAGLHHAPHERQLDRSLDWLQSQARLERIDRARMSQAH